MKVERKQKTLLFLVVLMFMTVGLSKAAFAITLEMGENMVLDCDVQLIYAAGIRVDDPHPKNLLNVNADDGNRNFDQWDMINNRFSAIADIDLQYKNVGYFIRPKAFYDFVYMQDNANDHPSTNNALVAGLINETDEFSDDVEDVHGRNVELLDYFGYASFVIGNTYWDLRAGSQVVQWGEGLFISGIAGAMAHVDLVAATTPGAEVKEILLPSQSVSLNVSLTNNLTVGGFYQWDWEHTKYFEGGTFFNYLYDVVDEGGRALIVFEEGNALGIPAVHFTRTKDYEPEDEDQYGFKIMYVAGQALNMTEFGLYYIHYHPKTAIDVGLIPTAFFPSPPFPPGVPADGYYVGVYWEDVDLYGASFSTQIGEANVSGEISYYQDWPIPTETGWTGDGFITATSAYTKDDFIQAQISTIYIYAMPPSLTWLCDQVTLVGEVGFQYVIDLDNDELTYDRFSWAGTIKATPKVFSIFTGVDMEVPVTFSFKPNGSTQLGAAATTFLEGTHSASVGLDFKIRNNYKFAIKYAAYWDEEDDGLNDRDNISCTFTYTF